MVLEFVRLFVCLKSNIIRDEPAPSIPARPHSSEGSGLPWQGGFKITLLAKRRKSAEPSLPQRPAMCSTTSLGFLSRIISLFGLFIQPQAYYGAGFYPVIKKTTKIAAFFGLMASLSCPGLICSNFCGYCTSLQVPRSLVFHTLGICSMDSYCPGQVCLETSLHWKRDPSLQEDGNQSEYLGRVNERFRNLLSSQLLPFTQKCWVRNFQLLAVDTRIIARKPQHMGHVFAHQIFVGQLLCIRHSARARVD